MHNYMTPEWNTRVQGSKGHKRFQGHSRVLFPWGPVGLWTHPFPQGMTKSNAHYLFPGYLFPIQVQLFNLSKIVLKHVQNFPVNAEAGNP